MASFVTEDVLGEGRRSLAVDVFKPEHPNGVAVLLLHGGGWIGGHRSMMHGYAAALAQRGYVGIAVEYRLLQEAAWPAQVNDVRDVLRWVRRNAQRLGIDSSKIALQGYSAGAHIALMVAGTQPGSGHEAHLAGDPTDSEVAAVVSFFAPARLPLHPDALSRPPISLLLAGGGEAAARAASPIYQVHRGFPPTLLLGGMSDYMQPLDAGLDQLKVFVEAGAEVEFHYLHSQVHEFPMTPGMLEDVMSEVAFFYRRTLLDRAALAEEARAMNPFARASSPEEFASVMAAAKKP